MKARLLAVAIGLGSATSACAAATVAFHIPSGTLQSAIIALGSQANVTVGIVDRKLAFSRVVGFEARMSVQEALERLLAGSAVTFRQIDGQTFQIVRRRPAPSKGVARAVPPSDAPPLPDQIVVTGSKRGATLRDYAGGIIAVDPSVIPLSTSLHGSEALIEQVPVLTSTHLGPGRDKLFIRGIADSSFTGPTQATVGQYLGEVRLNYNAPDPDLALYDISSVEVLEGPQGTLYGAGTLGGIVRLEPNAPDLAHFSALASVSGALTQGGAPGGDLAAIMNLPIAAGVAAIRGVAYTGVDGGYIDDPLRGLKNINRTVTSGGRATIRIQPTASWTIDIGAVAQFINSRDGQYIDRSLGGLQQASLIAQPYDNDYALGSVVIRHDIGSLKLVSATSFISHDVSSAYDASQTADQPLRYDSHDRIRIIANETHLSHSFGSGGSWVVGVEALRSEDRLSRTLGPPSQPAPLSGARNLVEDASLFGEATVPISRAFSLTGGGRLTVTRLVSDTLDQPDRGEEPDRHGFAVLPSAGFLWKPSPSLAFYGRYQEGYRPGGLSVLATSTQRFESDSLGTWEAGLRYHGVRDVFSLTAAFSYAHWENIQADLVDTQGLPFTTNIGSGRVIGFELRTRWQPTPALKIEGTLFADESRLSKPAAAFTGEDDASLPNIPPFTGRADASYAAHLLGRDVSLHGAAWYVGRSRLGVGTTFSLRQGGYFDTNAGLSTALGPATLAIDVENLLDHRGDTFALGNPFSVLGDRQATPLRARTIRFGVTVRY